MSGQLTSRLAALLARGDVEAVHIAGVGETTVRLVTGELVRAEPVAADAVELDELLHALAGACGGAG